MAAIIVVLVISAFGWYFFNKPHRNVSFEKAVTIGADSLFNVFLTNENKANALYLDKAIVVSGTISEVTKNQQGQPVVVLKTADPIYGVACTMKSNEYSFKPGSFISLKGICSGYTTDVVLRDCIIEEKQ